MSFAKKCDNCGKFSEKTAEWLEFYRTAVEAKPWHLCSWKCLRELAQKREGGL